MKEQIISRERLKNINEEWGNLIIRKFNRKLEREAESGKSQLNLLLDTLKVLQLMITDIPTIRLSL